MRLGVPKETIEGERRVAATPESVKKLKAMGFSVCIERGAGAESGYTDEAFEAAGAALAPDAKTIWSESEVIV
jgi:NAD(P) transhydrogenase subunit alpha